MGADGNQCAFAANVLMQLILQINEAIVRLLRKGDVTKYGGYSVRTDLFRRLGDFQYLPLLRLNKLKFGWFYSEI